MNYINNKKFLFVLFLSLMLPISVFGNVETYVDKKEISIGDNISLNVKLTLPEKATLIKPKYDSIKDWHIKDIAVKRDKKEHNIYDINIILTTFKPTIDEIPSINFDFLDSTRQQNTISTKPIEITVINTLASNVAEIDNLKSVKTVKKLEIKTTYLYIFFIFVIYFIVLIFFYIRKKKDKIKIYSINKTKNKLLDQLEKLLSSKEDFKQKYLEIFELLKKFIKVEYNIEYKNDIDVIISEIADLDITSSTFRILSNILNKVKMLQEGKFNFTDNEFANDIGNLKLTISNSIKNKE